MPPAELEDLLRSHPLVSDVAVAGVPHPRLGEAPRAYVVRREEEAKKGEEEVEKEVRSVCIFILLYSTTTFITLIGGV